MKELTKIEEHDNMTSEQVLAWARRFEEQKAQSAFLENLNKRPRQNICKKQSAKAK